MTDSVSRVRATETALTLLLHFRGSRPSLRWASTLASAVEGSAIETAQTLLPQSRVRATKTAFTLLPQSRPDPI